MTVREWSPETGALDFATLMRGYQEGWLKPTEVVDAIYDRIARRGQDNAWIYLKPRAEALAAARRLEAEGYDGRPLWGLPFSIKDCNDVVGLPTTNALKESAYVAASTGQAVTRLFDAGALMIGKTNMDQFGIGLVGVRTPYGACGSVFNDAYISGGSSSGSAVSVAAGLVSFSIANDAAGSGRVPAAFNNIVGVKPTPGLVSNACVSGGGCVKTIETLSVLSLTVEDGMTVLRVIAGYDPTYPFSRDDADAVALQIVTPPPRFLFGVPSGEALKFFGDREAERLFTEAVQRLEAMGGEAASVDFAPFEEAQRILYDGPWIAERTLSLAPILARFREALHPVTRAILEGGRAYSAIDAFAAIHRIAELKRDVRPLWKSLDFLLTPTAPTIYRKDEILAEPFALNARLGTYTNFVNLMGLSAVAVPSGFRSDGVPLGATFLGPGFAEARLAGFAAAFHRATGLGLGKGMQPYPDYVDAGA